MQIIIFVDRIGHHSFEREEDAIAGYRRSWNQELYDTGISAPRFPVPATIENADTASGYITLSLCPSGICLGCLRNWMDQLICDGAEDNDELDL